MAWVDLGTIALTREWTGFNVAASSSDTFRVSMPLLGAVDGYILLRPFYPNQGYGPARRFYPLEEARITTFRVPPELRADNKSQRFFQACLSARARVFAGQTWYLKLEEYV